jgi:hypothetical protein
MRNSFAFFFLFIAGCNSASESSIGREYGPTVPLTPGNFTGTWLLGLQTANCTATVIEADSLLKATVVNSSTHEQITIFGKYIMPVDPVWEYAFQAYDTSNLYGHVDSVKTNYILRVIFLATRRHSTTRQSRAKIHSPLLATDNRELTS